MFVRLWLGLRLRLGIVFVRFRLGLGLGLGMKPRPPGQLCQQRGSSHTSHHYTKIAITFFRNVSGRAGLSFCGP